LKPNLHISLHWCSAIVFAAAAAPVSFWQRLHKRMFADGRRQFRSGGAGTCAKVFCFREGFFLKVSPGAS
jgi:hypothetical protein